MGSPFANPPRKQSEPVNERQFDNGTLLGRETVPSFMGSVVLWT